MEAVSTPDASSQEDVYTDCFMRELSALEGRDIANSSKPFSKKKAFKALARCAPAKAQLAREVESQLAADPKYAEQRLRAIELQNRVGRRELPLMLLIYHMGR